MPASCEPAEAGGDAAPALRAAPPPDEGAGGELAIDIFCDRFVFCDRFFFLSQVLPPHVLLAAAAPPPATLAARPPPLVLGGHAASLTPY